MKRYIFFVLIVFTILFSCCTSNSDPTYVPDYPILPNEDGIPVDYDVIRNDMFLRHEGYPHGVPSDWDWARQPNEATYGTPPNGFKYATSWGQVYAELNAPKPDVDFPDVRVHLKDLQLYMLYKDGTWKLIQNVRDPAGFLYVEDFKNDRHKNADIRKESGGGISIKAGSGWNFHYFPEEFAFITDRDNVRGSLVVCKARLLGPDNAEQSKYILSVGGDYWKNADSSWTGLDDSNTGIGLGRFKYIKKEWQFFTMHSFKKSEVGSIVFPAL